jgi:hypothetical protein
MGGMASTARGPHVVPPRRRSSRAARWTRRIGGILATAALLGVGVAMALMILPQMRDDDEQAATGTVPAARPTAQPAKAHKKKAAKKGPTKAQLRARAAAVSVLRAQGYLPVREADYVPTHDLRVLVGYRNGDPLGPRRAFFFAGGRFVGHDTVSSSASLKVASTGKDSATLAYGIYAIGDKACCPSAGTTKVRFEFKDGALTPAGTVPTYSQRTATG